MKLRSTPNNFLSDTVSRPLQRQNAHIFLISFLILYLELALIRWVGSEIRIFAYLNNFILIACFLGVGVGCFQAHPSFKAAHFLLPLFILVLIVAEPRGFHLIFSLQSITNWLSILADSVIWNEAVSLGRDLYVYKLAAAILGSALTLVLFALITYVFVPLGRYLGALFESHPSPILAYSVNIFGSVLGTWAFSGLSFLETAPIVWFGIFVAFLSVYFPRKRSEQWWFVILAVGIMFSLLPFRSEFTEVRWSPYQKLSLKPLWTNDKKLSLGFLVQVNNTMYQIMSNLSEVFVKEHPEYFGADEATLGPYDLPYRFVENVDRVLVVGAGSGNDCAVALRHQARHVDCVDIDPVILDMGMRFHPERPYDNPRVRVIVDDARAFFEKNDSKYDLVWFGFLDSHSLVSSYNNIRLDHYIYTRESLEKVKSMLSESGTVVILFAAQRSWIDERLFALLTEVFGREPLAYRHFNNGDKNDTYRGTALITGNFKSEEKLASLDKKARDLIERNRLRYPKKVRITTDDWPFLYLEKAQIPSLHAILSIVLILCFLLFRKRILRVDIKLKWEFFFLGAGFLLLEVQSITKGALLFGSTWIVNSLIISQVLIWILFSNYLATRLSLNRVAIILAFLLSSITLIYITPLRIFNQLDFGWRVILGSTFLTLPIFFAGLLFIKFFKEEKKRNYALGSNLIGALCGGLLESACFIFGFKALLVPAALFYLAAYCVHKFSR